MRIISIGLLAIIGILSNSQIEAQFNRRPAQNCVSPNGYYGTCVAANFCREVVENFNQLPRRYFNQLRQACGNQKFQNQFVVCCTEPYTTAPLSSTANPFLVNPPTTPGFTGNPFLTTAIPSTMRPVPVTRPTTTTTTTRPTSAPTTEAPYCRDPNGIAGACVDIRKCPQIISELLNRPNDPNFKNFLLLSNEICSNRAQAVCCPLTNEPVASTTSAPVIIDNVGGDPSRRPATLEEGCGYSGSSHKKIVGGENAAKGAWPWIALLGYDDPGTFLCGGTLVSTRHVITAAHCLIKTLYFVRLGEHDLTTDTEAQHVDINIVKSLANPNYSKRDYTGDIAILYLERNVEFAKHIVPICLPSSTELRSKSYVDHNPFIAGWGRTEEKGPSSKILQELQVPILPNSVCLEAYKNEKKLFSDKQFDSSVVCAGVLSGGKDSCKGDSGGPLMTPELYANNVRYYLIGVVSYGVGCARPGIPGVYSSVQYFMDWILQKMAEDP